MATNKNITTTDKKAKTEVSDVEAQKKLAVARKRLIALKARLRSAENTDFEAKLAKKQAVLKRIETGAPATTAHEALAKAKLMEQEYSKLLKENADTLKDYEAKREELEKVEEKIKSLRGKRGPKGKTEINEPKNLNFAKQAFIRACSRRGAVIRYNSAGEPEYARFANEAPETTVVFDSETWDLKIGINKVFSSHYGAGSIDRVWDERKAWIEANQENLG
jgi:hypothetical protein